MSFPMVCTEMQLADTQFLQDGVSRIALLKSKKWQPGSQIHFAFRGGNAGQRALLQETLERVSEFVNLDFKLKTASTVVADLRIAFDPNDGAWSYIGTDAGKQPTNRPTMNLGFGYKDGQDGTYPHEIGHFLGAIHEHQNPQGGIQWNREQVIRDLSGPPNNWDEQTIESNMFQKYAQNQLNGTAFDSKSIMLYAIPRSWTTNGFSSEPNKTWSQQDINWLRNQYPGRGDGGTTPPIVEATLLQVVNLVSYKAAISAPGERDMYRFDAVAGQHHIEAVGGQELVLRLFGPNSDTNLVKETNNVNMRFNAQMLAALNSGTYYLQVSHTQESGIGPYGIRVTRLDDDGILGQLQGELVIKVTCPALPGTMIAQRL